MTLIAGFVFNGGIFGCAEGISRKSASSYLRMEGLREGFTAGWKSTSNKLHASLFSFYPSFPPFPCGALAIPIYLFLLPTEGKALPEYALCCWGLSGMLDSAFFPPSSLTLSPSAFAKSHCLYPSSFPTPPLPPLALCSSPWQPGGQIGPRLS